MMRPSRRRLLAGLAAGGTLSIAGCLGGLGTNEHGSLAVEWESGAATAYVGNHHGHAVAEVDGSPVVAISRNDLSGEVMCGIAAFDADGKVLWDARLAGDHCGPHAIGYIGVGDLGGDDSVAFLVATETREVLAFDAETGEELLGETVLDTLGFSPPVTVDFSGDGSVHVAVSDFTGTLYVLDLDGSVTWTAELETPAHVGPLVGNFTDAEGRELVVTHGRLPGEVVCLDGDGEVIWRAEQEQAVTSWSHVETDDGPAIAATDRRTLRLLDGATGETRWSRTFGANVAVGPAADGRLFLSSDDGTVRRLGIADGEVAWRSPIDDDPVSMRAPTVLDPTAEGRLHVGVNTHEGRVALIDADAGEVTARRDFERGLFTPPRGADVTGDGSEELIVFFGDARVAALSYVSPGE